MIMFLQGLLQKRLKTNSYKPNATSYCGKRGKFRLEKEVNKNSSVSMRNRDNRNLVLSKEDSKKDWETGIEESIKSLTERFDKLESENNS